MKTVIVGTAGHIDHGKSELVAALTGTHPDRLREERERGITIDIGFANRELRDLTLSFVDVPGHERFVKNMLAGASGIDLVLLVVAADESVRPQTREHFHICRLLGLNRGVIALTKTDLAEAELVELTASEVRDLVEGSFLEGAPMVPVSAKRGEGLERLVEALRGAGLEVPERDSGDSARLPIDRAFSVRGFGTVVTGTLVAGSIRVGDELELLTARRRVRVRGVEVHGSGVPVALAGQRTALNLQGISHHDVRRGDLLAEPDAFEPTRIFDASVAVIAEAPVPVRDLDRVRVHAGTAEILARARPLGTAELGAGCEGYLQLRLERPTVLLPGDRFIVRRYSPPTTLGGGVVLDAFPSKHRRADGAAAAFLASQEGTDLGGRAEAIVASFGRKGLPPSRLARRLGASWVQVAAALRPAVDASRILALGAGPDLLLSASGFEELEKDAVDLLGQFHARHPLAPGCPLEEFRGRLEPSLAPEGMRALMSKLTESGALRIERDVVALAEHRVVLSDSEDSLVRSLSGLFLSGGLNPPDPDEALARIGVGASQGAALLSLLVRQGTLRRLRDGRLFHAQALEQLQRRLREYRSERGETIDIATFKDLAGVSRKNAIPLLEHFDEQKVTLRRGSERVILG